jgi:hypothetical protein
MSQARRLLLAALIAATALSGAAASPAVAATPSSFFGVMGDGPLFGPAADLGREAQLMRGAGVGSTRVAFYWRDMQPAQDRPVDWSRTDRIVGAAAAAQIDVFPILLLAPAWATTGETLDLPREGAVPDSAAYAQFARDAIRRYGPQGSFWTENPAVPRRPIRAWQVWNEPDIERYWVGEPWAPTYVTLLKAAHAAIKAEDPGATVVAAGLTNRSWEDLALLYEAGGRGFFDAAAIHPFSRRVSNVVKIVGLARAEMRRRGDARVPLVLSEISWSSGKGRSTRNYGWETSERGQAERVTEALTALARERTRLRIASVYWYTWLSPKIGSKDSFSYGGLRRLENGRAVSKPALGAFRKTVRRLRAR